MYKVQSQYYFALRQLRGLCIYECGFIAPVLPSFSRVLLELSQLNPGYEKISLSTFNIQKYVSFKPLVRQLNLAVKNLLHLHHAETNCFRYSVYILNKLSWLPYTMEYCLKSSWGFH